MFLFLVVIMLHVSLTEWLSSGKCIYGTTGISQTLRVSQKDYGTFHRAHTSVFRFVEWAKQESSRNWPSVEPEFFLDLADRVDIFPRNVELSYNFSSYLNLKLPTFFLLSVSLLKTLLATARTISVSATRSWVHINSHSSCLPVNVWTPCSGKKKVKLSL
jgi:hypothetical protein